MLTDLRNTKKVIDLARKIDKKIKRLRIKVTSIEWVEVILNWRWKLVSIKVDEDKDLKEILEKIKEAVNKGIGVRDRQVQDLTKQIMEEMKFSKEFQSIFGR